MTRIRLKIDQITSDAGLDRVVLETALRREVERVADRFDGTTSGYRPQVQADLPKGQGRLADRVAGAALRAVAPNGGRSSR